MKRWIELSRECKIDHTQISHFHIFLHYVIVTYKTHYKDRKLVFSCSRIESDHCKVVCALKVFTYCFSIYTNSKEHHISICFGIVYSITRTSIKDKLITIIDELIYTSLHSWCILGKKRVHYRN